MANVEALRKEVAVLEALLGTLDNVEGIAALRSSLPPPPSGALSARSAADLSNELRPFFRRLFSSDLLEATGSSLGGGGAGVVATLEVVGGGDAVSHVVAFVETETRAAVREEAQEKKKAAEEEEEEGESFDSGERCATCDVSLKSGDFVKIGNSLFCPEHSAACAGCGQGFASGKVVTAMNQRFHLECFVCHECKKPFANDESIFVADNLPYCELHAPPESTDDGEGGGGSTSGESVSE